MPNLQVNLAFYDPISHACIEKTLNEAHTNLAKEGFSPEFQKMVVESDEYKELMLTMRINMDTEKLKHIRESKNKPTEKPSKTVDNNMELVQPVVDNTVQVKHEVVVEKDRDVSTTHVQDQAAAEVVDLTSVVSTERENKLVEEEELNIAEVQILSVVEPEHDEDTTKQNDEQKHADIDVRIETPKMLPMEEDNVKEPMTQPQEVTDDMEEEDPVDE